MAKLPKSTPRQQAAFKKMLEKFAKREPVVLGTIMREVGFSAATAINPGKNLTSKVGWECLKRELDSGGARDALNDLVSRANGDSRTRLSAAVEILKIVSPDRQGNVIGLFEKVGELQASDRSEDITGENQLPTAFGAD